MKRETFIHLGGSGNPLSKKYTAPEGKQGWNSGENTILPPMGPGFYFQSWHHVCVEFFVGSLLAPRGFSLSQLVFPSLKKPTVRLNSHSFQNLL